MSLVVSNFLNNSGVNRVYILDRKYIIKRSKSIEI